MTLMEIARRWTILILAEVLKTTSGAIEAVLPFQPRWLAQIALLATQLQAAQASGDEAEDNDTAAAAVAADVPKLPSLEALLDSHTRLRQGASDIVARGLALDPELLQRMRTDWNVESVVSYLSSADTNLRDAANRTLNNAAEALGISVAKMTELGKGTQGPTARTTPTGKSADTAKPSPTRIEARRRATAR